ncbi:hypothetical protein BC351_13000 [Paenibacillus ferrarius]|uniref:DUF350 domain-containing protein n=1 Tax=Paenibacillus ferrarius TaxID=1469647 RepID=A0A1V4H742_9BACL|nr:DUF350 domain-containing protein [Paenibacillus ferrarius]OPH46849.1 hypothetical protein BC351_13000 [Paenibacillus ferrarius]
MIVFNVVVSLFVIVLLQFGGMYIFSLMTPYREMEEVNNGNVAVGISMGGQFVATAIVLGIAAYTNSSISHMSLWFAAGYVCVVATYWVFDWLTPGVKLSDQLKQGNVAVGTLLAAVYIGIAIAVSSLIV